MGPTARNIGSNGNIKKRLRNVQTGDGVIGFLGVKEEVVKGARFVYGDKGGKKGFGSVEMAAPENVREKRE